MTAARMPGRSADPLGIYMVGFLYGKTRAEARQVAEAQWTLAVFASDPDGVAHWNQVLTFLALTDRGRR